MINWAELIARLERTMRHIDIAVAVSRSEAWVGALKRGEISEPPHSVGELLNALDLLREHSIDRWA
ncbi:MAG: hypothetical protein IT531_00195 [Burkholderiales bacterium]|nr:hypothetical protein [Burkholderiales bacterium]